MGDWHQLRRRLQLLCLAAAILIVGGCDVTTVDGSLTRVRTSGRLVVGVDPSYPPFAVINGSGEPDGLEIDLAKEIARRIGVVPEFVAIDVGGVLDALIARKIDVIISGLPPYPEYARQLAYSRPYFNAGQVLVVPTNGPNALKDLAGRKVGVESGSTGDLEMRKWAANLPVTEIKSYTTAQAALDDARAGNVDGVITDYVTAREYLEHSYGLVIAGPPLTEEFYVVAARRVDSSLLTEVNTVLDALGSEGYLTGLENKWLR